jgi:hypothetical protein
MVSLKGNKLNLIVSSLQCKIFERIKYTKCDQFLIMLNKTIDIRRIIIKKKIMRGQNFKWRIGHFSTVATICVFN